MLKYPLAIRLCRCVLILSRLLSRDRGAPVQSGQQRLALVLIIYELIPFICIRIDQWAMERLQKQRGIIVVADSLTPYGAPY